MGVIKRGILGGFSGKVANVVGSSWKGIGVMKALPLSVANPKTAAQTAQRTKFSNVVAFAGIILSTVIKPLWDRFAQGMSGYNDFVQTNISEFAASLPATPANLVISKGKMASTAIATPSVYEGGSIDLDWADDSDEGLKLATDIPYFVAYCVETEEVVGFTVDGVTRASLGIEGEHPFTESVSNGDTVEIYMAFKRADGTVVSDTAHAEVTASA